MKMYKKIVFFDDLSEKAKEQARQWYKDGADDYMFLTEELERFIIEEINKLGYAVEELEIFYSLSNSQGDGVSFVATLTKDGETYEVNRNNSNYSHEMTMVEFYHEDENGEAEGDDEMLEKMRAIAKQAEKIGYDYIDSENSDDTVDENIRINEYTFTLEGERMDADIMGKESKNKRAFDIISDLMDIIEANEPDYYYKSDLIASADDFLKEFDGQQNDCNGNACYNCEAGFGACGETEEEPETV